MYHHCERKAPALEAEQAVIMSTDMYREEEGVSCSCSSLVVARLFFDDLPSMFIRVVLALVFLDLNLNVKPRHKHKNTQTWALSRRGDPPPPPTTRSRFPFEDVFSDKQNKQKSPRGARSRRAEPGGDTQRGLRLCSRTLSSRGLTSPSTET